MNKNNIRILLVDDHPMLRDGLHALITAEADLEVIGEASTGMEALELIKTLTPDVLVIDLGLPDISGFKVIQAIRDDELDVRIVVLSMHIKREFVIKAVEAGCDGYVPKSSTHVSLLDAIRIVHSGERYLHPQAATALVDTFSKGQTVRERYESLTNREQEVIQLSARGFTSREIGEQLTISPKTVETYRQRSFEKLAIESRAELIKFAVNAGILDDLIETDS